MENLRTFELDWGDGTSETIKGYDIADAFRRAGYGGGAIRALKAWKEVKDVTEWDSSLSNS